DFHVVADAAGPWDATLNQANVGANNNKFYIIQILQHDTSGKICFWNRYGRVGSKGQSSTTDTSVEGAKGMFKGKFREKTGNSWDFGKDFAAQKGKYTLLEMDYGSAVADDSAANASSSADAPPPSALPGEVQELVRLVCDTAMMQRQMVEIGYNAKKLPLGKLSKKTIADGYQALKDLEDELDKPKPSLKKLQDLSSDFYTLIPHDFGFQNLASFVINTKDTLKAKLLMLEALADIELATKLLTSGSCPGLENPLDAHHRKLKCNFTPLMSSSDEWKLMELYMKNTHGATHSAYELKLHQLFDLDRQGEVERFEVNRKDSNRQLLWHGSRLTNWCGILSQGLRIAPPEAPVSGYMFGKGVYFADSVSKSANYCCTNKNNPRGVMLLCEVALGEMNELLQSDSKAKEHLGGKTSTLGQGRLAPDPAVYRVLPDGVHVPVGPLKEANVKGTSLQYNEFIVYEVERIRMRYLLVVDFVYKK
ncbi:unnamed protein product, partial [Polarella glacialis]